ncbi:MAG: type II secretion system protein GspG [Candidatus Aminicenantes bacterium]|nr:type II secretion system protein GspG [Candidatus Aminicenantes bacterium]
MMKKVMIFLVTGILVGAAYIYPAAAKTQTTQPIEKNSFTEVTSKLDQGGNIYLYVGAERAVKSMDELAAKLRQMIEKEVSKSGAKETDGLKVFDFAYGLIKDCGLMEISGVGMSSIPIDANLNHSKLVLHHYQGKNNGVIWRMLEAKPHELTLLRMLPASTAAATFSDFKLNALWDWVKKEAAASDLPKVKEFILALEPMLLQKGIPLGGMLNSIDGMGFVLMLDSTKKSVIPLGPQPLEIPEPAFAIILSVKDDTVFNLLQSKLTFAVKSEDPAVKKLQIPLPPLPVPLAPVILQKDGLLIIASNNQVVETMFAAKEKGDGLIASADFIKLSANIPAQGNSFRYVSPRLMPAIMDIQKKALELSKPQGDEKGIIIMLLSLFTKEIAAYGVLQNTDEGMIYTFNHTMNLENILLLPIAAPVGIVAAIAVPNYLTAMQKGKQKATMSDMKALAMAIDAYIVDHKAAPAGKTLADIKGKLQPKYIKEMPIKDAWGNDFQYSHGVGANKAEYAVGAGGKDGVFNGWEQAQCYSVKSMKDFDKDLIIANGKFTCCPGMKEKCAETCAVKTEKECEKEVEKGQGPEASCPKKKK